MEKRYFEVEINKYIPGDNRKVYRPASLNNPKAVSYTHLTLPTTERV